MTYYLRRHLREKRGVHCLLTVLLNGVSTTIAASYGVRTTAVNSAQAEFMMSRASRALGLPLLPVFFSRYPLLPV